MSTLSTTNTCKMDSEKKHLFCVRLQNANLTNNNSKNLVPIWSHNIKQNEYYLKINVY